MSVGPTAETAGASAVRDRLARLAAHDALHAGARNLCLFDLDHTLLPIDSDHAWNDHMVRLGWVDEAEFRRASESFFAAYRAGSLDIAAYIEFATRAWRDRSPQEVAAAHLRFMREVIEPQLRAEALGLVRGHQSLGDLVALVTSTNEFVTAPIAEAFGIPTLLAVELERGPGGTITGRIAGTPSHREGKVTRVEQWLQASGATWCDFRRISVYSDSWNDLPLLERATDPVAVGPSAELETIARERDWPILM